MEIPPIADKARLERLFPTVVADNPDTTTFELGLVLGGSGSAGAYTAGALDFLLEALEAWHDQPAPPHRVIVKTAAGTSGGAVCASILGLLSSHLVPHVSEDATPKNAAPIRTGNPLWDLWVNEFQIARLLATSDIMARKDADAGSGAVMTKVQHVPAVLNCEMIDAAGADLARFGQTPGQDLPWFTAPFRVAVTVANLRGIPYQIQEVPQIAGFSGAAYVQHDDFAWFAYPNGANPAAALPDGKREDEFWLGVGPGSGFVGYDTAVAYATASGAIPIGLAARSLSRPVEHYNYRPRVRPSTAAPGFRIDWPLPLWTSLADAQQGTYTFSAVDGGTFNNDPVTLVHRALAGLIGQNPRSKSEARRAILMIDPLADEPQPIARVGKSLLAVIENIIGTAVGAARYLTADMELFASEDVFSRFQMVPFRPDRKTVGGAALCGATLYAAGGWCAREFRVHDYLLGRHNMQVYLRQELVLAGDNKLFDDWNEDDRGDFAVHDNGERVANVNTVAPRDYFLPILPDKTETANRLPAWPTGACDADALKGPLEKRLTAVINGLVADNAGGGVLPWLVEMFAVPGVVDLVVMKVVEAFKAELTRNGL